MNIGVFITAIVMLLIMCSPIFFFHGKGKKTDKKESSDKPQETKTDNQQ